MVLILILQFLSFRKFMYPDTFHLHMYNYHKTDIEKNCPENWKELVYEVRHRRFNQYLRCKFSDCDKLFNSHGSLKNHITRYHENQTFSCKWCDKVYKWESGLRRHVDNQHKYEKGQSQKAYYHRFRVLRKVNLQELLETQ